LFSLFETIVIQDKRKVPLPMPEASLLTHSLCEQILLDPRASVREKDLDLFISQTLPQVLADLSPSFDTQNLKKSLI